MINVGPGVCDACAEEFGLSARILATMASEFPNEKPPLPWNHSYWAKWRALWAAHEQPVADLTYDDSGWKLCARHLRALADRVEAANKKATP